MKYLIIDNFIKKEVCDNLISDVDKYVETNKLLTINVNRQALFSSSLEFENLIKKSESWHKLSKKINSVEFLNFCKEKLEITKRLSLKNFFKANNPSEKLKLYKNLSNEKLKSIQIYTLTKFLFYRIYRETLRKIKFSRFFNLKETPVELLFDYSKAGDGYFREIHRDSDSRLIVFLIYLNSLPSETKGGSLDIFKLKNNIPEKPARPKKEMCEKIESIEPKPGRLVIFRNDESSYHSVEKISNSSHSRSFVYGGFTTLSGINPYIKSSRLSTIFSNYD